MTKNKLSNGTIEALAVITEQVARIVNHEGDALAELATLRQAVHELGIALKDDHRHPPALTRSQGYLTEPYATTADTIRRLEGTR